MNQLSEFEIQLKALRLMLVRNGNDPDSKDLDIHLGYVEDHLNIEQTAKELVSMSGAREVRLYDEEGDLIHIGDAFATPVEAAIQTMARHAIRQQLSFGRSGDLLAQALKRQDLSSEACEALMDVSKDVVPTEGMALDLTGLLGELLMAQTRHAIAKAYLQVYSLGQIGEGA